MNKEAALDFSKIWGGINDVGSSIADLAKWLADKAIATYGLSFTGGAIGGLATGYMLSKATSPTSVVKNSDKELEREALDTEIDVTERKLAALELRKRRRAMNPPQPKYDRFV